MGRWGSYFPSELELGDQLGEEGEIVFMIKHYESMTWTIGSTSTESRIMREPTVKYYNTTVLSHWPEQAPLRAYKHNA